MALRQSNFAQNATAPVATQVVTVSSAPLLNSIIILWTTMGGNGSGIASCPGFSVVPGLGLITNAGGTLSYPLLKVAGASEPTSYTVTPGSSSNWTTVSIWEFTGRNTTTPVSAVSTPSLIAAGGWPLSLPLTGLTAAAGDDILCLYSLGKSGFAFSTFTPPSGFSNALEASGGTTGFEQSSMGCTLTNASAGATGTVTASQPGSGSTSDAAGVIISIAAASAPSSTAPIAWIT